MNPSEIYNEPEVLGRFYNGSHEAFTILYKKYSEPLYYNILSMVKDETAAEELVQEIFTDIWHKRDSIRIETNFGSYIFSASRNRVYSFFEKAGRDQKLFDKVRAIATENYSHVEEALLAKENRELLEKAIASLSPQRRKAFQLCKLDGLSYKEASEEMGISVSTVRDHMAHARAEIKEYIATHREIAIWILLMYCLN